jgi:hypothetical protein
MGEKSAILLPASLMTTEYIEWSRRERDALIEEFNDQHDPAGEVARAVFAATWPQIENTLVWVDGVDEARKQFILLCSGSWMVPSASTS